MLTVALLRTELIKNFRRLRTYIAFGILVFIPVIMGIVIDLNPPSPRGDGRLLYLASQTGLILPAFALRVTSAFLLVIVVALFGGDAIAGEASWGNLRYMLMRPIGRGRLADRRAAGDGRRPAGAGGHDRDRGRGSVLDGVLGSAAAVRPGLDQPRRLLGAGGRAGPHGR